MGVYGSYIAPDEYIFVSDDPVPSIFGTHYWDKAFSLNACAVDQVYFTTLVWTREIFSVKQIAHVAIAKCTLG